MRKILIGIFMFICVFLVGCGKEEPKEWTYELLEKEFGGIVELSYAELKDCLKLLSNKEHGVYGYVREFGNYEFMGHDMAHIEIADNEIENKYERKLRICCEKTDLENLSEGDYVYANGTFLAKVEYTRTDYSYQINTDGMPVRKNKDDKDYITVRDFYELMDEILDDTFFEVEGLIIKDGGRYYLYQSEETYKESKYNRIEIEFSEPQRNLNGKVLLIIGKPEVGSMYFGLIECSVVEEK